MGTGRLSQGNPMSKRRVLFAVCAMLIFSAAGLRPHKGHSNGTAVDFFVPVRTLEGKVSQLPISSFNLFGYAIQFDRNGRSGSNTIDFEGMALHLLALERAVRAHGIGIRRVIFDVNLQPKLAATGAGGQMMKRLAFNKQRLGSGTTNTTTWISAYRAGERETSSLLGTIVRISKTRQWLWYPAHRLDER
jgi:hypothetical protein